MILHLSEIKKIKTKNRYCLESKIIFEFEAFYCQKLIVGGRYDREKCSR